eukprot:scaffold5006_cov116-Isochrysis_galbana.AAC.10
MSALQPAPLRSSSSAGAASSSSRIAASEPESAARWRGRSPRCVIARGSARAARRRRNVASRGAPDVRRSSATSGAPARTAMCRAVSRRSPSTAAMSTRDRSARAAVMSRQAISRGRGSVATIAMVHCSPPEVPSVSDAGLGSPLP